MRTEMHGVLIELNQLQEKLTKLADTTPTFLQLILKKVLKVFALPQDLPPPRERDHVIVLKEGTNLISVRPYQYP